VAWAAVRQQHRSSSANAGRRYTSLAALKCSALCSLQPRSLGPAPTWPAYCWVAGGSRDGAARVGTTSAVPAATALTTPAGGLRATAGVRRVIEEVALGRKAVELCIVQGLLLLGSVRAWLVGSTGGQQQVRRRTVRAAEARRQCARVSSMAGGATNMHTQRSDSTRSGPRPAPATDGRLPFVRLRCLACEHATAVCPCVHARADIASSTSAASQPISVVVCPPCAVPCIPLQLPQYAPRKGSQSVIHCSHMAMYSALRYDESRIAPRLKPRLQNVSLWGLTQSLKQVPRFKFSQAT
jgi:hypothetical protein